MQTFTRSTVRQLEKEMLEVLNRHGFTNVSFAGKGARFDSAECTFKINARVEGATTRAESELEMMAKLEGIDVNKRGPKGEKLIEYHSRKPKYPWIYETVRGARYKCTTAQARAKFGA